MTHKKLKPADTQGSSVKPAAKGRVHARASNLEVIPVDPTLLEKVRKVLKRRGFPQYQK